MFRNIIFKLVISLWFIICSPLLVIGLLSEKSEREIGKFIANGALFIARTIGEIKYQIHYPLHDENGIPFQHNRNTRLDGRAIIASKHMSVMETLILFVNVPQSFFIIKRELLWIPIYGWAFKRIGLIGVNRKPGATNMKELTNRVMDKIMDGKTLIIFPEGTRANPGTHPTLKRGLLFIAESLKLPIMPVGLDTGLYWPRRGRIVPGTAHIYFEQELPSSAKLEEIHDAINKHSA